MRGERSHDVRQKGGGFIVVERKQDSATLIAAVECAPRFQLESGRFRQGTNLGTGKCASVLADNVDAYHHIHFCAELIEQYCLRMRLPDVGKIGDRTHRHLFTWDCGV